jgi:hypothetical protein
MAGNFIEYFRRPYFASIVVVVVVVVAAGRISKDNIMGRIQDHASVTMNYYYYY